MTKAFHVEAQVDELEEGEHGVPYLVTVRPFGSSGLVGTLRVLQFEEDGVNRLRIVWARLTCSDEDAPMHDTLGGTWWTSALDAVLEEVTFHSPAVDQAVDVDDGRMRYGWAGGEVREMTLLPAGSQEDLPVFRTNDGPPSSGNPYTFLRGAAEAARRAAAAEAALTEEALESFFDDVALFLAEKAFDREPDEGNDDRGAAEGGPVEEEGR